MHVADEYGQMLVEETGEDIVTVSTPKFVADAVSHQTLRRLDRAEYKLADFVDLVQQLKLPLASSLFRESRFPEMDDKKAETIEGYVKGLLNKTQHRRHGIFAGSGTYYVLYVVDVPRGIELLRSAGVVEENLRGALYHQHSRTLAQVLNMELKRVERKMENVGYA